jgi:signal transduction histidine kinase/ActR/RegA family two-component response regulator
VELVQGGTGFLTVAPVVREGEDDGLVGFVVSVSVASDVLTAALAPLPDDNLVVRLFREEEGVKGTLGSWPAGAVGAAPTSIVSEVVELSSGAFRVEVEPTSGFEASHRSAAPRWVLTAGLMFTALLAGYVRLLGSRAAAAREHAAMLTREMEERRRAEAAAVELEARFRALAEEAPVGIYLLQDGRFQYVNHRFAKAFGMAPADVHTPDELPATGEAWLPGDAEIEVDGRTLQLHAVHTQIDGREAVIGTVNDVTEARRSESERQRAEQLEALGVLAASIAHDFNNLLAVILGNVSMAQMRAGQSSSLLAEAEQAVLRAQGLTSQLSSFARGGEPVRVPMDVGPVVREAVAFALRGSAATASVDVEAGVWAVNGDSSQLSRVFHNLVLNAVQAMDGRGKVTVSVRNRVRGAPGRRYVEIQVQDQGKGMAPETPEHIFDPYFTTRTAGRGLGLASAHSIVRRHQGQIEVESAPGQGASFTVVLPAHDGPAAAGKDAAGPAPAAGGERVLVMDDDPFVRSAAARLVESHGYVVVAVDDGRQAVAAWRGAIAEGRPFAAAILDLTVPGGHGGQQAIAEILDIDPTALGIASSGYADDPIMANFAEYGFAGVLPKPYRRDEIGNVLRRVIATR